MPDAADLLTAKARGILLRLPHFYDPAGAGPLLLDVAEGAGTALERAEAELYRVLRSHHVETADDEPGAGYNSPLERRGDLDRILALYLEQVGGTSLLVKVSTAFTARSVDPRRLARRLEGARDPAAAAVLAALPPSARELLDRFRPEHARVHPGDVRPGLVLELLPAPAGPGAVRDALSPAARRWLDRALAADPAAGPPDDAVRDEVWALLPGWSPAAARAPAGDRRDTPLPLLLRALLAGWVRQRLSPETVRLLEAYDGRAEVDPRLAAALAEDLNRRVLPDPQLFLRNAALFSWLPLPEATRRLRGGVYRDRLRARADEMAKAYAGAAEADRAPLRAESDRIAAELERADAVPTPPGDDLARLNRLLLEAAWPYDPSARPWGLGPSGIPSPGEVRQALVDGLNAALRDPALAGEDSFPDLAADLPALRAKHAGRLDRLNRAVLERAFPEAVEPSYAPYRERLLGLIQVLRRGASTRKGIVDVVAANLGILGADPESRAARELVRIVEFAPVRTTFYAGAVPFWGELAVDAPNAATTDAEFRFTMRPAPYAHVANLRITALDTGETVEWRGRLRAGDRLQMTGGTVLLNGIAPAEALSGPVPGLRPGRSRWRFEADVVVPGAEASRDHAWPVGRFGPDYGAAAIFDRAVLAPSEPAVDLEIASERTTPATFTVSIPYNIPGFTDKFEPEDHPRDQILSLVRRVKAAGVEAWVAYRELFAEDHAVETALALRAAGRLLAEAHDDVKDAWLAESRQQAREDHDARDTLVLSGTFDHTRLDSLNTFA